MLLVTPLVVVVDLEVEVVSPMVVVEQHLVVQELVVKEILVDMVNA